MTLIVADARKLVGLTAGDSTHDVRLQQLITAAYEQAAEKVGPLSPRFVTEVAYARRGQVVLRRPPVTSLTSITGLSDLSGLEVHQREGLIECLPYGWPDGPVTVSYVSGFSTIPASVEEGVRAWVRHRWLQESYGSRTYGGDEPADAVNDFPDLPYAVRNAWGPYLLTEVGLA